MAHPLVDQLRFARSEFHRGLEGVSDEEARHRFLPMKCLSWNIGHLAAQEQRYWLLYAQGTMLLPEVDRAFRYGSPPRRLVWTKCGRRGMRSPRRWTLARCGHDRDAALVWHARR